MAAAGERGGSPVVDRLVAAVRSHVGVDVAYLTQYGLTGAQVRAVAGDAGPFGLDVGAAVPLNESVCLASTTGRLPSVIPDTRRSLAARRLAWNRDTPIGAFAAAPVHLTDGGLFGALCLAHRSPRDDLGPSTEEFLNAMADVLGSELTDEHVARHQSARERQAIMELLDGERLSTVLQPIVRLDDGRTLGVEALTRFASAIPRPPNLWFGAAARHGLGVELEAAAISRAFRAVAVVPTTWHLAVNASPALLEANVFESLLVDDIADRLVIEVTEHAAVNDYRQLRSALRPLRDRGIRIAVDDAGAGFSSLRHVVELHPEVIKIDGSLVRGVDIGPLHRAMIESLTSFAHRSGATLVAEAVETPQELAVLQELGVHAAQGYLFAAPGAPADLRDEYPVSLRTVSVPEH
jgi:EAL domain-containing protein (putative c-di-GMP-specific phosphodiesterase class I)